MPARTKSMGNGPLAARTKQPQARRIWILLVLCVSTLLVIPAANAEQAEPSTNGYWIWPTGTPVGVVRAFDPPAMPWLSGHRGVDLDAPIGSTVLSPADGTVIFAGTVVDREVVSVMHAGGLRSTYEPVTPQVSTGQVVSAGQVLGVVEEGHSPGNLHWGARFEKNEYIDPLRMLVGPSILKPWD